MYLALLRSFSLSSNNNQSSGNDLKVLTAAKCQEVMGVKQWNENLWAIFTYIRRNPLHFCRAPNNECCELRGEVR